MRHFAVLLAFAVLTAPLGLSASASETTTYEYDALGRLTKKSIAGAINNGKKVTVCYDAAGNRKIYKVASNGTMAVCPLPPP
jgi:YD repeat-containing protein